jgi:hypothetical protein
MEKRNQKICKRAPGDYFGPVTKEARGPAGLTQRGMIPFPSPADEWDPLVRVLFNLQPLLLTGNHRCQSRPSSLSSQTPNGLPIYTPLFPTDSSPFPPTFPRSIHHQFGKIARRKSATATAPCHQFLQLEGTPPPDFCKPLLSTSWCISLTYFPPFLPKKNDDLHVTWKVPPLGALRPRPAISAGDNQARRPRGRILRGALHVAHLFIIIGGH